MRTSGYKITNYDEEPEVMQINDAPLKKLSRYDRAVRVRDLMKEIKHTPKCNAEDKESIEKNMGIKCKEDFQHQRNHETIRQLNTNVTTNLVKFMIESEKAGSQVDEWYAHPKHHLAAQSRFTQALKEAEIVVSPHFIPPGSQEAKDVARCKGVIDEYENELIVSLDIEKEQFYQDTLIPKRVFMDNVLYYLLPDICKKATAQTRIYSTQMVSKNNPRKKYPASLTGDTLNEEQGLYTNPIYRPKLQEIVDGEIFNPITVHMQGGTSYVHPYLEDVQDQFRFLAKEENGKLLYGVISVRDRIQLNPEIAIVNWIIDFTNININKVGSPLEYSLEAKWYDKYEKHVEYRITEMLTPTTPTLAYPNIIRKVRVQTKITTTEYDKLIAEKICEVHLKMKLSQTRIEGWMITQETMETLTHLGDFILITAPVMSVYFLIWAMVTTSLSTTLMLTLITHVSIISFLYTNGIHIYYFSTKYDDKTIKDIVCTREYIIIVIISMIIASYGYHVLGAYPELSNIIEAAVKTLKNYMKSEVIKVKSDTIRNNTMEYTNSLQINEDV